MTATEIIEIDPPLAGANASYYEYRTGLYDYVLTHWSTDDV